MLRYKLLMKKALGLKSPLQKSTEEKLEALTNYGMIDMMYHQQKRHQATTHFTLQTSIWQSWIRK